MRLTDTLTFFRDHDKYWGSMKIDDYQNWIDNLFPDYNATSQALAQHGIEIDLSNSQKEMSRYHTKKGVIVPIISHFPKETGLETIKLFLNHKNKLFLALSKVHESYSPSIYSNDLRQRFFCDLALTGDYKDIELVDKVRTALKEYYFQPLPIPKG